MLIGSTKTDSLNSSLETQKTKYLFLHDAFDGKIEPDIDVKVLMLNINHGKNTEIMNLCKPLKEYSWFVERIRFHGKTNGDLETSIDRASQEMPVDFQIRKFLLANKAEVRRMCITEYDEAKTQKQFREEGKTELTISNIKRMHKKGLSKDTICELLDVPEEMVDKVLNFPE